MDPDLGFSGNFIRFNDMYGIFSYYFKLLSKNWSEIRCFLEKSFSRQNIDPRSLFFALETRSRFMTPVCYTVASSIPQSYHTFETPLISIPRVLFFELVQLYTRL